MFETSGAMMSDTAGSALGEITDRVLAPPTDASGTLKLRPYEPDLRAIDGLARMLEAAASPQEWQKAQQALAPVFGQSAPTKTDLALARAGDAFTALVTPDLSPVGQGVPQQVLVGEVVRNLVQAIPIPTIFAAEPRIAFAEGLVIGTVSGLVSQLQQQIRTVKDVVGALCGFYSVVYDVEVLASVIAVWLDDPGGSSLDDVAGVLQSNHPDLWTMLTRAGPFMQQLDRYVQWFQQAGPDDVLRAVADWFYALPQFIGKQFRPTLLAVVDAVGDPKRQGELIGDALGPLALSAVMTAVGIAEVAANGLRFMVSQGALLLVDTADTFEAALAAMQEAIAGALGGDQPVAAALSIAGKQSPELVQAGKAMATAAQKQLYLEYGRFRSRILPHRYNKTATGQWNETARKLSGLTVKDLEYAIGIRLDSHHIVEDHWFDKFPAEFKKIFTNWAVQDADGNPVTRNGQPLVMNWTSAGDMDALALHTEAHIRSPKRMGQLLQIIGLENYEPLSPEMTKFFKKLDRAKDGVGWPFNSAKEVILAHKLYYLREQTRAIWPRVEKWFARAEAAIANAGF